MERKRNNRGNKGIAQCIINHYMTLDARRCRTRRAPMSRFGGARVGGVHKLWLRSRTDSSR